MIFERKERNILVWFSILIALAVLFTGGVAYGKAVPGAQKQKTFASPEEAVKAVVTATKNNDDNELLAIFGPSSKDLLFSGDAVADKQRREQVLKAYDEKNSIVPGKAGMVMVIGSNDWPFPIPIVKKGDQWFFDTKAGREEILNRRIGQNELSTIQTLLAVVDAQREYAMNDADGDGIFVYAEKFLSDPGKKNGLHWVTKEGEKPSPLGDLVARAYAAGYTRAETKDKPKPLHGYYFRMLKKQGKHADGGAYDYIVKGRMFGGFAVVAHPAKYGNSGVMTFLVNHDGVVYQKDLGKNTAKTAKGIMSYNPGPGWKKVEDSLKQ